VSQLYRVQYGPNDQKVKGPAIGEREATQQVGENQELSLLVGILHSLKKILIAICLEHVVVVVV